MTSPGTHDRQIHLNPMLSAVQLTLPCICDPEHLSGLQGQGYCPLPGVCILLGGTSLWNPFIPLARAEKRTFQMSPEGQGVERADDGVMLKRLPEEPHPLARTQGHRRSGREDAGRGGGWQPGTSPWLSLCPCAAWLDLSGSVHRAAVAC